MAVIEYDEFYNYLIIFSAKHLDEYPEDKNRIKNLLEIIKKQVRHITRTKRSYNTTFQATM